MNTEDPIDSLLRSHFASRLDRQRGRTLAAFDDVVAKPAKLAFGRSERRRPFRTASGIGLALAASVALGFTVPSLFRQSSGDGLPMGIREPGAIYGGSVSNPTPRRNETRNSWQTLEDQGPVMINPTTPGRRVLKRQVEEIRWTDSEGKEHAEYVPSEQQLVVEQAKQ